MTTTSFAVLGLLCLQPWSAYELTGQMRRSLRFLWPRAESGLYREPQKLVDLGYATATEVAAGPRRTKQQYAATPAGRMALREWMAAPSAPPQFESEAMVKFFFADQGELGDARAALEALAGDAEALRAAVVALTASHDESPGPFPQRQHIGSLIGRFVFDYADTLSAWASWAGEHLERWPSTGPDAAPLGAQVQRENAELAQLAQHRSTRSAPTGNLPPG